MTVPCYINEHQSDIRAIKPGWYAVERNGKLSSGRFQARRNASPESLSRRIILEHRPGGTRPMILKLPPTRRATRKRPRTTWLTRKLLWTLGTRRRRRERGAGFPLPGVINPPMSADGSGLFERARRTSAIGGKADIPRKRSTDAYL
jgi:hypothetical protein